MSTVTNWQATALSLCPWLCPPLPAAPSAPAATEVSFKKYLSQVRPKVGRGMMYSALLAWEG